MNTTSLLYFVTLASCLNFTEAASKVYVSQPTLSRHIFDLEEEVGTKLFTRTKKGIYLTSAGEHFLSCAEDILRIQQSMLQYKGARTSAVFGHLHMGISPHLSYKEGFPFISSTAKKFPDIEVTLRSGTPNELFSMLVDDTLDAVWTLVRIGNNFDGYGLKYLSVPGEKKIQILVNPNHPLAKKETVSSADLQGESFILYRDDHSPLSTSLGQEFLYSLNIQPTDIMYVSDYSMLETYIYFNRGISLINEGISRTQDTDNVRIPLADSPVTYTLSVVYKENFSSPVLRAYLKEFQTFLIQM